MEDLNKSQLILLAILVSFVTSITTGVLTVSMLTEDAPTVTQTINRVVERTIEKVVPGETKTVVKEVPVGMPMEEEIIAIAEKGEQAVATFSHITRQGETLGLAFVLEGGAYVVTNGSLLRGGEEKDNGPYVMTLPNGTKLTSKVAAISTDQRIAILNVTKTEPAATTAKNILSDLLSSSAPAVVGLRLSPTDLTLGQTLIAVGSTADTASPVTVGLVSSLVKGEGDATSTVAVKTNAATADNLGAPLLNTRGELSAMTFESGTAVPARLIRALIDSVK